MSSSTSPAKPAAPPGWQWLMRITGAIALLLFLTPTVYVIKYYSLDRPREQKWVQAVSANNYNNDFLSKHPSVADFSADELPALIWIAQKDHDWEAQEDAIGAIEMVLRQPGMGWKRPVECLSAKAALAEAATKDPSPNVRQAASEALTRIARGGAVIRR